MAKLTEGDKREIRRVAEQSPIVGPKLGMKSPAEYVAFASLASQLTAIRKTVRFVGIHWKL